MTYNRLINDIGQSSYNSNRAFSTWGILECNPQLMKGFFGFDPPALDSCSGVLVHLRFIKFFLQLSCKTYSFTGLIQRRESYFSLTFLTSMEALTASISSDYYGKLSAMTSAGPLSDNNSLCTWKISWSSVVAVTLSLCAGRLPLPKSSSTNCCYL